MTRLLMAVTGVWRFYHRFHYAAVFLAFRFINLFIKRRRVPKVEDDILLASAVSLARKIRNRELTSEQVVRTCIKRCLEVNPLLNAIVEDNFQRALEEARKIDEQIESDSVPPYDEAPFLGVPICMKDHFFVYGMLCTAGISKRRNIRMFEDADVVALMKKAGAVIVCTTNTSEMCMWYESSNTIHGRTSNPYDSRCTSGGSSGGQGALVGAAALPFAVGSDLAGSIRIPAYFNGIFGHKTSRNIISQKGIHPQAQGPQMDLYAMGPMCRYAEDLLPMLKVLAGPNVHLLSLDAKVDLRNLRIFYMTEIDSITTPRVDHELKECIHEITKYFHTEYDVMCYKLDLEYMHWALSIWLNDMDAPGSPSFGQQMCNLEGDINPVMELFKWIFGLSNHTYPALALALVEKFLHKMGTDHERQYVKSMERTLYRQLEDLLSNLAPPTNKHSTNSRFGDVIDILSSDDFDWSEDRFKRQRGEAVFLFPPHPVLPPFHNQSCLTPFAFQYTAIFNSLGLPVTCCPLGLNRRGTPLAVQVVGGPRKDHVTLAVARELERAFGGWIEP